jgi:hypothetical protein
MIRSIKKKKIQEHCVFKVSRADFRNLFESQNWKKKTRILGSHGFRLDLKPHKIYFFELSTKFYIKSSPKTSKLAIFHLKVKKEQKIRMGATRQNFFLR